MKTIYIAGKYRDKNSWLIEQNVRVAEKLSMEVAEMDLVALCPHTMSRFFAGTLSEDYWIKATLELMKRADAVLLCPNWRYSEGTKGEIEKAAEWGIPVFPNLKHLKSNLDGIEVFKLPTCRNETCIICGRIIKDEKRVQYDGAYHQKCFDEALCRAKFLNEQKAED